MDAKLIIQMDGKKTRIFNSKVRSLLLCNALHLAITYGTMYYIVKTQKVQFHFTLSREIAYDLQCVC
jgi:hypothetical protein